MNDARLFSRVLVLGNSMRIDKRQLCLLRRVGELAVMVMEGVVEGTRLKRNHGFTTFGNGVVKPTRNARCRHKIGTVREYFPEVEFHQRIVPQDPR